MRAAGLQGDASPEIIEIIDDDTDAFGGRAPTHPGNQSGNDGGGPRWVGPVAAAVLLALIAYGVATSSSSSSTPKVAPVTSTSVATATTLPPPTTVPPPPVPYYAADPPRKFNVRVADIRPNSYGNFAPYQLWATGDATATSGSWFSIETYTGGTTLYAVDAYRKPAEGGVPIGISYLPTGHTIAQFSRPDAVGGTITSFGWSDDDLVRLAESIVADKQGILTFTDAWFAADHRMISSVPPWVAVQGIPTEQVVYATSDEPPSSVGVFVAERPPSNEGGSTLDRQTALQFFFDHNTPFAVDGHSAVAGTIIGQNEYAMASWIADDHIVTVSGEMPVPQLIAIAQTVHQVSSAEWEGMKFQAIKANSNSNSSNSNYDGTPQVTVSQGTDADGEPWTVSVSLADYGGRKQLNWFWGASGGTTTPDDAPQINTVVDDKHTVVLADLPRSIAPTAELRITREGLDPVTVLFADVDPEFDRVVAAYAFSETVPYTAQIVGPDGAVLASWPSP